MSGYLLFIFGVVVWRRSRKSGNSVVRSGFAWVMGLLVLQMVLGIVTVMHSAPWSLAILHQLGGIALWVLVIRARFLAGYPPEQFIKGA